MKEIIRAHLPLRALLIGLAAIAPGAFPAAQAGYSTLHDLAYLAIIPAAILLALAWALFRKSSAAGLAAQIRDCAVAGAMATVALEAVRYSGFRMGFMPGNLPELMGVLLFDRFALGPTAASTLGGFIYHFWNGACFGIIFALGRFNLPVLVGRSLRSRFGRRFPHQSRGPGIGRWHFRRELWMALRCYGPHSPPGIRCRDGCDAPEKSRSRSRICK